MTLVGAQPITDKILNVLFVGESNTARSIIAEALLSRLGGNAFQVFSAGRNPAAHLGAHTLEVLKQAGCPTESLRPKSWNEFVSPSAPTLDVVITLDEGLKNGPFPIWYNKPVHVHWPFANPQALSHNDSELQGAHRRLYGDMEQQMLKLAGLKLAGLSNYALQTKLMSITPKP